MTSLVLPVRRVHQATPRTRLLTVDLENHPFAFQAGQAVTVGLADNQTRRPYSIASSPAQARASNSLELLVQIDDHSAPDPHLERAKVGTLVGIDGPFGTFGLPLPIAESHALFIAGGTGIAPLRSMLWELLEHQRSVLVDLIYSARSPDEFAFLDELRTLASERRLDLHLTVTRDTNVPWSGARGRIDGNVIRSALKTPQTRCLVCGPPALVNDAVSWLRAAGVPSDRIGWEAF